MRRRLHVHDMDVAINEFRVAGLGRMVREFMEELDVGDLRQSAGFAERELKEYCATTGSIPA